MVGLWCQVRGGFKKQQPPPSSKKGEEKKEEKFGGGGGCTLELIDLYKYTIKYEIELFYFFGS